MTGVKDASFGTAGARGSEVGLDRGAGDKRGLVAAGGLLAAIGASSCCILPLVLFGVGLGGAWLGNLTALAPYQPIFLAVAAGLLGYGFYLVYRKPRTVCAGNDACSGRPAKGIVKVVLWVSTMMVAVAAAFPYVAPSLLGV